MTVRRSRADEFLANPANSPEIVDNLPVVPPVTERELELIETYLGHLIGDVLKG